MAVSFDDLSIAFEQELSAPGSRSLRRLGEIYDDYILELERIPEAVWAFYSKLFRTPTVLARRGLEHFLLEMNSDLEKYSAAQLQEFLTILGENISRMEHEIARHAAGDFVARCYPPQIAFRTFQAWSRKHPRDQHAAFVGLDVLKHRDHELTEAVSALRASLLERHNDWVDKS